MFESNNIMVLLAAILPAFLYSYIIFHFIPSGYIKSSRVKMYAVTGLLSPTLVFIFNFIFPHWMRGVEGDIVYMCAVIAFIQVGLVEELTKYITFWWVSSTRKNVDTDLPIATMYYCMMSATAFAVIENIHYLMAYGDSVLLIRGVTAIVLHMICGLVMGYFIVKSRTAKEIIVEKIGSGNTMGLNLNSSQLKRIAYIIFGVASATALHGIYDFNLFLPVNFYSEIYTGVILCFGLIVSYMMAREMVVMSKDLVKQSPSKYS